MDAEQLLKLKRNEPFTPFRLRTLDGADHLISSAESFLVTPDRIAFVDGPGISQVALTHVATIELINQP